LTHGSLGGREWEDTAVGSGLSSGCPGETLGRTGIAAAEATNSGALDIGFEADNETRG
jgi:hypothetical protein